MNNEINFNFGYFLMTVVLLSLFSCVDDTQLDNSCEDSQIMTFEQSNMCSPKIMSYHFGVETLPIIDQISKLANLQMDGIILQIESNSIQNLEEYYRACEVKSGAFSIYNIFTSFSLDNQEEWGNQMATIEYIYKKIQHEKTILQVIFNGEKRKINTSMIIAQIAQIAEIAEKYNKDLVIYPHEGTAIETAEEALIYIKSTNQDNVFLSVHLCHELAAGNGGRIEEVITNVSQYIKAVSISGATENEQFDNTLPLWFWAIKPLNMGTYDYTNFYKALYEIDYKGPIAIHTWGILENFGLSPEDHLPNSRELILELAAEVCN